MFHFWMVWKYLRGGGRFVGWTSFLALLGLIIGVGCLVLTMSVISGVESYLRQSIIDVTGHFIMMDRSGPMKPPSELEPKLKKVLPEMRAISPFVHLESLIAYEGKISGVVAQGLEKSSHADVLDLESRVLKGKFSLEEKKGHSAAVVGTVLAEKMNLKVGDNFQLVVPRPSQLDQTSFSPRLHSFYLAGILDMGKFEYNERLVLIEDVVAQELKNMTGLYSGYRMRFSSSESARSASYKVGQEFGYAYFTRDWYEVNHNFFSAVEIEKWVIFVVLLFIVIVACFNVCSTLFVHVLKRYSDISVLKTLGAGQNFLVRLFISHGLLVGALGSIGGIAFGLILCFIVKHSNWIYVPGEIYKFDHLPVEVRASDLFLVLGATFLICFISTLLPAYRGAKLKPVEGLRYE